MIDRLTGTGEHTFDLTFHLLPGIKVQLDPSSNSVHASNEHGASLHILPINHTLSSVALIEGATDPIQGWVGLHSGQKQPAPTVRYRHTGLAPTSFCTLLYPQSATESARGSAQPIQAEALAVITQPTLIDQGDVMALRIERGDYRDDLLLASGTAGFNKRFADYETDAELVYIRQQKHSGRLLVVETFNGSKLYDKSKPLQPLPIIQTKTL